MAHMCLAANKKQWLNDAANCSDKYIKATLNTDAFIDTKSYSGAAWRLYRRIYRQEAHKRGLSI